jgi:hypothetical protein
MYNLSAVDFGSWTTWFSFVVGFFDIERDDARLAIFRKEELSARREIRIVDLGDYGLPHEPASSSATLSIPSDVMSFISSGGELSE